MAVKETCAVLFVFSLVLFPALISSNDLCARSTSNFTDSNTGYVITVSPTTHYANTEYNVTVSGTGPIDLILEALNNEASAGNWAEGTSCSKGILLQSVALPRTVVWNSTNSSLPVKISAYINHTESYINISTELTTATTNSPATTNSTATTNSPATTNATVGTSDSSSQAPVTSATQATTVTVAQTTSGSSMVNPSSMLMALIQSFGMLLISVKLLS